MPKIVSIERGLTELLRK